METAIAQALQLILVITPNWETVQGTLFCFERDVTNQSFLLVDRFPSVVGQKGMAWGIGLHSVPEHLPEPLFKREGDRKAPAGIFRLGPLFADQRYLTDIPFSMPLIVVDSHWEAVDDPSSAYYNQLVDIRAVPLKDWFSSEQMCREDDLYHLGMIIEHNRAAIFGRGSCIFMHRWRTPTQGTYGCTALAPQDLEKVLKWLNPQKEPLIVQLPTEEYEAKKGSWGLPNF